MGAEEPDGLPGTATVTKPDLTRLFRSEGQFMVLASLVLLKDCWQSVSDLTANTELPQSTVSRIVHDLWRQGVIEKQWAYADRPEYRLNGTSPVFHELIALVEWEVARREASSSTWTDGDLVRVSWPSDGGTSTWTGRIVGERMGEGGAKPHRIENAVVTVLKEEQDMAMTPEETDDHANNLVVTGALFMALTMAQKHVPSLTEVTIPEDGSGNQLDVSFSFMNSPYRITVERLADG